MTKIDWENITNYIESVGSTDTVFPFKKPQSSVTVTARGARDNIIYTIGGQSGTLTPGQSVTITGSITTMTLRSASGTQPFQVWAVEAGTEKDEPETDFTTQLAQSMSQTINVKYAPYNAKGDGVTDDTAAIQSAINDAHTQNKVVYLPPGTYKVTSSLTIYGQFSMIGSNNALAQPYQCRINCTAQNLFVGSTPGTANAYFLATVYMSNIAITGNGTNTMFQFMNLSCSIIKECYFYNFDYIINGILSQVSNVHHNQFINIGTSLLSSRQGNVINTITDAKIHHNYINGNAGGTPILIDLQYGNYAEIHHNFFDYANTAIKIDNGSSMVNVNNNLFDVCYQPININSGNGIDITNNQFGKCSKSNVGLFHALSTDNQTLYSSNNWRGIIIGAGVHHVTIHNNIAFQSDILIDVTNFGNNNISTSGNINAYTTGVIVNFVRGTDAGNPLDGRNLDFKEMSYQTVTSLPSPTIKNNVTSFAGQFLWYKGKLVSRKLGNYEVDTLNVTAGATTSGNITVTLNGTNFIVALVAGDSAATVASKIQAVAYSGWTVTVSGTTVTFTANLAQPKTAPSFTDSGTTGVTATFVVTTAGTNDTWTDTNNAYPDNNGANVTVTAGATTKSAGFPWTETDTNYIASVTPSWNTTWWVTAKTTNGFTINFGTAAPSGATIDWFIRR